MPGIVDQWGFEVRASGIYKSPLSRPLDFKKITPPRPKTFEAVLAWQRRELVDISRIIAGGVPTIDDALVQAGEFSVGQSWHLKYKGDNRVWGKQRDEWFNRVYAMDCNYRGRQNDWLSTLRQLVWTRKVHGDYGIVFDGQPFTDSEGKTHEPSGKFSVITYDRIGTGINVAASVGNGLEKLNPFSLPNELGNNYLTSTYPTLMVGFYGMYRINDRNSIFDGQRIIDGQIVDANMRTLGWRINGFNENGGAIYVDVPEAQIHINFAARKMPDMVRGFPEITEQILPILHLDDIEDLISMAMKLASRIAVTRKSSDGFPTSSRARAGEDEPWPGAPGGQGAPQFAGQPFPNGQGGIDRRGVVQNVEEIFPGFYELAVNNKETVEALGFERPSMNEEAFIKRIEIAVLHKLWPRSLIYAEDAGRAGARALALQARTICEWDQICLERSATWIAVRATEFAMRQRIIPANNNLADPYQCGFTVPAQFTVDEGNDQKMRLSALGRGIVSKGKIMELDGYLAEEIEEEREAEVLRVIEAGKRIFTKHPEIPLTQIILWLDNGGSNLSFMEQDREMVEAQAAGVTQADTPKSGADEPNNQTPKKKK